jgi:hypothetical protein
MWSKSRYNLQKIERWKILESVSWDAGELVVLQVPEEGNKWDFLHCMKNFSHKGLKVSVWLQRAHRNMWIDTHRSSSDAKPWNNLAEICKILLDWRKLSKHHTVKDPYAVDTLPCPYCVDNICPHSVLKCNKSNYGTYRDRSDDKGKKTPSGTFDILFELKSLLSICMYDINKCCNVGEPKDVMHWHSEDTYRNWSVANPWNNPSGMSVIWLEARSLSYRQ